MWRQDLKRIYTRTGDKGETGLLSGERVSKGDLRLEAGGAADEAVSAMGLARALSADERVRSLLLEAQRDMVEVGSEISAGGASDLPGRRFKGVTPEMTARLEKEIDALAREVDAPPELVTAGACAGSAALDVARAQVRRAEREAVRLRDAGLLPNREVLAYLNRLSDLVFMLARFEESRMGGGRR